MPQLELPYEEAERRLVLELWRVDEIFNDATDALLKRLKEDNRIERKPGSVQANGDLLAIYVSMWANTPTEGGIVAIGIDDKTGAVTGCVSHADSFPETERRLRRDLVPDARFDLKKIQVNNESGQPDFIMLVRVHFRDDKVVETNKGEAYIRVGHSKHLLSPEERQELERERGQKTFELEPCGLSWPEGFDLAEVNSWVEEVCKEKGITKSGSPDQYLLRHKLGTLDKDNFVPNNACALLFAKDPQAVIPGCMLRFQRIDGCELKTGHERNVGINKEFVGTVPRIIADAKKMIGDTQIRKYAALDRDGKFFPVPEYPEEAWLELIVNACVHRSYSLRGSNIVVRMFDDHFVVESPGGFPGIVTPENIYQIHHRRNWWLMDAMRYMRYVLCESEGLKRVRRALADMGLPEPQFEHKSVGNALVRVTLRNNQNVRSQWVDTDVSHIIGEERAQTLTEEETRVINFAVEHGDRIKTTEAMKLMTTPRWGTAQKLLKRLLERGIFRFVSRYPRDTSAYYILIRPNAAQPSSQEMTGGPPIGAPWNKRNGS
jgi:ATP-dependent DNA helicase RecG